MNHLTETPQGQERTGARQVPSPTAVNTGRTNVGQDLQSVLAEGSTDGMDANGLTILPEAVRQELEPLIRQLEEMKRQLKEKGKNFRLTLDGQRIAVRACALLKEYSAVVPELTKRTDIIASRAKKFADSMNIDPLSEKEHQAIEKLRDVLTIQKPAPKSYLKSDPAQRKISVALVRLLRKGNRDEELEQLREERGLARAITLRWEKEFVTATTRDLVPEYFPAPVRKDVQEDVVKAGADAPEDTGVPAGRTTDANMIPEIDATQETQTPAPETAVIPSSNGQGAILSTAKLGIVERITAQNGAMFEAMKDMEPTDPRIAAFHALIGQNRGLLRALGIELHEQVSVSMVAPPPVAAVTEVRSMQEPGAIYRTPSGAELIISRAQKGVVLILEGDQSRSSDVDPQ